MFIEYVPNPADTRNCFFCRRHGHEVALQTMTDVRWEGSMDVLCMDCWLDIYVGIHGRVPVEWTSHPINTN